VSRPSPLATWLLGVAVPERDRDVLIGDLVEEHGLRGRGAAAWYWSQALRTLARLLWTGVRRGRWLRTLGAVLAGYAVVSVIVVAGDAATTMLPGAGEQRSSVLSLAVGFPAMVLGGYLAARLRRRAAEALAVLAAVIGLVSLVTTGDRAPLWYQLALVVAGPTAALLGGRIRARRSGPPREKKGA
jgi:hypothetical protein